MAKPNYQFEKRQRDLAKQRKQEEKRQQKLANKAAATASTISPEPDNTAVATADSETAASSER